MAQESVIQPNAEFARQQHIAFSNALREFCIGDNTTPGSESKSRSAKYVGVP